MDSASSEFRAGVENRLFGMCEFTQLNADELDIVNDLALQEFSASASVRRGRYAVRIRQSSAHSP
jgi:hypothetical protein